MKFLNIDSGLRVKHVMQTGLKLTSHPLWNNLALDNNYRNFQMESLYEAEIF